MKVLAKPEFKEAPEIIRPVAMKWIDALQATLEFMQPDTGDAMDDETMHILFSIVLQAASGIFAPGDLTRADRKRVEKMFAEQLQLACEQFRTDRNRFLETGSNLQ